MHFIDILSFCLSILGLYGLIYSLRFLIPRNVLPRVSAVLADAERLLDRAESTGVIPHPNDYRSTLAMCGAVIPSVNRPSPSLIDSYGNEFLRMRTESHRAPGILQQLRVAFRRGLTCRLYMLSSRVEAIKVKIEVCSNDHLYPYSP